MVSQIIYTVTNNILLFTLIGAIWWPKVQHYSNQLQATYASFAMYALHISMHLFIYLFIWIDFIVLSTLCLQVHLPAIREYSTGIYNRQLSCHLLLLIKKILTLILQEKCRWRHKTSQCCLIIVRKVWKHTAAKFKNVRSATKLSTCKVDAVGVYGWTAITPLYQV